VKNIVSQIEDAPFFWSIEDAPFFWSIEDAPSFSCPPFFLGGEH
jgi:hypothetical protein